ncbi:DUF2007 domain-containing protein [Endozoicomonas gorgoniicola]|uniref:DUF2007 domain-containing protein n=1 Tax=Endozoicomonas gorgoniicola TaxID=1234144 RepID=A0ABT3MSI6_9GAMM|nr:DUF2007 domain-containing protein [Endozoicomonas gorgoniicola]MCW7552334.1 DUF2007 domain-containing protein [Endozoicomonas gorgoniicola]
MLVTISRYSFPYEAWLARGLLDSQDIPAFVFDEHLITMNWLYSNAIGGVRLLVPEVCADSAKELLALESAVEDGEEYYRCQQCGSCDTEIQLSGKRRAFLVFMLIQFPLFPVREFYYCRTCGCKSDPVSRIPGCYPVPPLQD